MLDRRYVLALSIAVAALGCKSTTTAPEWSYTGATGPAHWGEMSPDWALAETGREQSPIDIKSADARPGSQPAISVSYPEIPLVILNNGHTVEVKYTPGGKLSVGQATYELKQFHFHSPSEHTLNGEHAPLEVHLVHADATGKLAVLAVLVEEGAENAFLAGIWPHLPREKSSEMKVAQVSVDVDELLPNKKATWRYSGSLTTPPCSQEVAWFMLQEPVQASAAQLESFRKVMVGNNRPTQPLNGRAVTSNP
jgi:carbonic anhydrase